MAPAARQVLRRALQHVRARSRSAGPGRRKRQRTVPAAAAASAAAPAAAAAPTGERPSIANPDKWIRRYASPATLDEASEIVATGGVVGVWSLAGGGAELAAVVASRLAGAHVRVRASVAAGGAVREVACSCYPDSILFCPHVIAVLLVFAEADEKIFRRGDTSPQAAWGLAAKERLSRQQLVDKARVRRHIDGTIDRFSKRPKQRRMACDRCDEDAVGTRKGRCLSCGLGQLLLRKKEAPLFPLLASVKDVQERATALLDSSEFEGCAALCEAAADGFLLAPRADADEGSPLHSHGSLATLANALVELCMIPACDPAFPERLLGRIASVVDRVAASIKSDPERWQGEARVARAGWSPLLRSILDGSHKAWSSASADPDPLPELFAAGETESSLRVRVAGLLQRNRYRKARRLAKAAGDVRGLLEAYEGLGKPPRRLALRALSWPAGRLVARDALVMADACREDEPAAAFWLLMSAVRSVRGQLGAALDTSAAYTEEDVQEWSDERRRLYEEKRRQRYRRAGASFVDDPADDPREDVDRVVIRYATDEDEDDSDEENDYDLSCKLKDTPPRSAGCWPLAAAAESEPETWSEVDSACPWEACSAWRAELTDSWHPDAAVAALDARLRNLLTCAADLSVSYMKRNHPEAPPGDRTLLRLAARAAAARLLADPTGAAAAAALPDELASLVALEACALAVADVGRGLPHAWRAAIAFGEARQPRLALYIAAGVLRPGTHPAHALYSSEEDGTQNRTYLFDLMKTLEEEEEGGPGAMAMAEFKIGRNGATIDALFACATMLETLGKIDDAIRVCTRALELAATPEHAPFAQTSCMRCVYLATRNWKYYAEHTMRDWLIQTLCPKASAAAVRAALASPVFSSSRITCEEDLERAHRHAEHLYGGMLECSRQPQEEEGRVVRGLLAIRCARMLGPNVGMRLADQLYDFQVEAVIRSIRSAPPELEAEAAAALPFAYLLALDASSKDRPRAEPRRGGVEETLARMWAEGCATQAFRSEWPEFFRSPIRREFVDDVLESALQSLSFEQFEREIVGELACPEAAAATAAALFCHAARLAPFALACIPLRSAACAAMQRAVRLYAEANDGGRRRRDAILAAFAPELVPALRDLAECVGPAAAVECGRLLWPVLPRGDLLEGILACIAEEERPAQWEALLSDDRLQQRMRDLELSCKPDRERSWMGERKSVDEDFCTMVCETAFRSSLPQHAVSFVSAHVASGYDQPFCLLESLVCGYASAKGLALPVRMSAPPVQLQPALPPDVDWAHVAAFARECAEGSLEAPLEACTGGLLRVAALDGPLALELLRRLVLGREATPPTRRDRVRYDDALYEMRWLMKWAAAAHQQAGAPSEWEQLRERLSKLYNRYECERIFYLADKEAVNADAASS